MLQFVRGKVNYEEVLSSRRPEGLTSLYWKKNKWIYFEKLKKIEVESKECWFIKEPEGMTLLFRKQEKRNEFWKIKNNIDIFKLIDLTFHLETHMQESLIKFTQICCQYCSLWWNNKLYEWNVYLYEF